MAPTKPEKEGKLTPEQSAALVLDYLRRQNRPYSATDISTNLKNRVTKTTAAKLLKDMHERKEIEGRAAGKQIVYHVIQEEANDDELEQLRALHAETSRLRQATATLKLEEVKLRAVLREDATHVPLHEIKASVGALQEEKVELSSRLAKLRSGSVKPVGVEECAEVLKEHSKWRKAAIARKNIRNELWMELASIVGTREEIEETKEALGLEF